MAFGIFIEIISLKLVLILNNLSVIEVIKNMLRVDLNFTLRVVRQRQKI